jgi:hypothetical protein
MAAGSTYTPIATYTVPSATSSYTFTSIPSTYTDLVLISSAATVAISDIIFQVGNGSVDTATNYSYTNLSGDGSSPYSSRASSITFGYFDNYGAPNTTLGNNVAIVHFMNYSNSTTYKTVLARSNNASLGVDAVVSLWRSTSSINTILVKGATSNLKAGTTFTLYGIAAA